MGYLFVCRRQGKRHTRQGFEQRIRCCRQGSRVIRCDSHTVSASDSRMLLLETGSNETVSPSVSSSIGTSSGLVIGVSNTDTAAHMCCATDWHGETLMLIVCSDGE